MFRRADVFLSDAIRLRDVGDAERVLDAGNLLNLVPNVIVILLAAVAVDGFWKAEPTHEVDEGDGGFQGRIMARAVQNAELSAFANKRNQIIEAGEKTFAHVAGGVDVPSAQRSTVKTNCGCTHGSVLQLQSGGAAGRAALDELCDVSCHTTPFKTICHERFDGSLDTRVACVSAMVAVDG